MANLPYKPYYPSLPYPFFLGKGPPCGKNGQNFSFNPIFNNSLTCLKSPPTNVRHKKKPSRNRAICIQTSSELLAKK